MLNVLNAFLCVAPSAAQGTDAAAGNGGGGGMIITLVLYIGVIGLLFYFMAIRPPLRQKPRYFQHLR